MKPKLVRCPWPHGRRQKRSRDRACRTHKWRDHQRRRATGLPPNGHWHGEAIYQLRQKVAHHVIDVVDPDEEFNVARYRELATASIHDIRKRGKQAIVCGGTGLYIKALTRGLFLGPAQNAESEQRSL